MILLLDDLALFLNEDMSEFFFWIWGRRRTSGKEGEEEESGFSSSIRRSEHSILKAAATVCYPVS